MSTSNNEELTITMTEDSAPLLRGLYAIATIAVVSGILLGIGSHRGFVGATGQVPSLFDVFGYSHLGEGASLLSWGLIGGGLVLGYIASEFLEPE